MHDDWSMSSGEAGLAGAGPTDPAARGREAAASSRSNRDEMLVDRVSHAPEHLPRLRFEGRDRSGFPEALQGGEFAELSLGGRDEVIDPGHLRLMDRVGR